MDEEVFSTVALQTSGFGVAELHNPASRAWDENWARANASRWTQQCPAEAGVLWSLTAQAAASPGCRKLLAPCPLLTALCYKPCCLPVSRIHPVSSSTVPRWGWGVLVSLPPCQPLPRHLPQDRAQGTSQPSVEPVWVALITSAVWMALLGH